MKPGELGLIAEDVEMVHSLIKSGDPHAKLSKAAASILQKTAHVPSPLPKVCVFMQASLIILHPLALL